MFLSPKYILYKNSIICVVEGTVPQLGIHWWVCKPMLENPCTNKPLKVPLV